MLLFPKAEDRSPWGDFWFTPVGTKTTSGMQVTGETAMRLAAVYACVRVLSETMAMLPFQLSQMVAGKRQYVTDHWLYQLLARRPNDYQNRFEWHEMMMGHLALRGNAYNRIVGNAAGEVTALLPIHPDKCQLELATDGTYRYRVTNLDGSTDIVPRGQIWHLRGLSTNGYVGLSPIEVAAQTIGVGLGVQEYGARFFANDARPGGGWIKHPGNFKDKESRDIFKQSWQAAQTGANRHKTAVLEWGMEYHELSMKNNDAQFLETRQFQVIDIARIFRVPPHLIGDLTRGTFSNIEQQSLEFMAYSMAPWAERIEASIVAEFLPDDEEWEVEYDFTHLMRGDAASRTAYYKGGIGSGWLTRNEAREAEGYEPLPGLDEPLMPLNFAPTGETTEETLPGEPDPAQPTPDDEGVEPSVHRIAQSTATRIIRKEVGTVRRLLGEPDAATKIRDFYAAHAELVSDAFAVDMRTARSWCDSQLHGLGICGPDLIEELLVEWEAKAPLTLARLMCK